MGKMKASLLPSFTNVVEICLNARRKKRRRMIKYTFNISKGNEFEKSRKVFAAKRKSLVLTGARQTVNKPQAAQTIDEDKEDALFLILNSVTPNQLRIKELSGGF